MKTLPNAIKLYCCPECGAIMAGHGSMSLACCGKQMDVLSIVEASCGDSPSVQEVDGGHYLTFNNPMTKDFYIAAIVVEYYDHYDVYRLFPEQEASIHLNKTRGAKLHVVYRQQDNVWQSVFRF